MNNSNLANSVSNVMCEPQTNLTINEKVNVIEKDTQEIASLVNEISNRIYGGSRPRITEECCSGIPICSCIESTLDNTNSNIKDIINMLNDILKTL